MDYVRIMERALALIEESPVLVHYNLARASDGTSVAPTDPRAVTFSLEGAFEKAFDEERWRAYERARSLLERRVGMRKDASLSMWNDGAKKEEVCEVVREALEDARARESTVPEREVARRACRAYGAYETARLLDDHTQCYPAILRSALGELGATRLVTALCESGVRVWKEMAVRHLGLCEEHVVLLNR